MKSRIIGSKCAVHFIRRDMQEAEALLLLSFQRPIVGLGNLQHRESTVDVRPQKRLRTKNRAIDMTLSGKVHHRARSVLFEQFRYQPGIANIALDEGVIWI